MSFNRENTIWVSRDGTWSRGFYEVVWTDPDGDPEWDVEYDMGSFEWVAIGLPSEDAARAAWDGANPGGYDVHTKPPEYTDRLDDMAKAFLQANPPRRRVW